MEMKETLMLGVLFSSMMLIMLNALYVKEMQQLILNEAVKIEFSLLGISGNVKRELLKVRIEERIKNVSSFNSILFSIFYTERSIDMILESLLGQLNTMTAVQKRERNLIVENVQFRILQETLLKSEVKEFNGNFDIMTKDQLKEIVDDLRKPIKNIDKILK